VTHALHRAGNSFQNDWIIYLYPTREFKHPGAAKKLVDLTEIVQEEHACNYAGYEIKASICAGETFGQIKSMTTDKGRFFSVFSTKEDFINALRRIKEYDAGLSVVVAALTDEVREIARGLDIKPHTINMSLGIFGNKAILPEMEILEVTTMCGHGMVSPYLVKKILAKIKKGLMNVEEGAIELAKPCVCGIFNPIKASELLKKLLPLWYLSGRRSH
jgi:hypothetical protein